jgi:hypothetical protein
VTRLESDDNVWQLVIGLYDEESVIEDGEGIGYIAGDGRKVGTFGIYK